MSANVIDMRSRRQCPHPIQGDDGTVKQCIERGHCGCNEDPLPGLSATEQRVLNAARRLEDQMPNSVWAAPSIQFEGWPYARGYQSVSLGISAAIRSLIKRGLVKRMHRGFYMLEKEGK